MKASIPNPDLPPLLQFQDGSPVRTPDDFKRRREEIRALMCRTFIGNFPKQTPAVIGAEVTRERKDKNSIRRRIRLTLDTPNKVAIEIRVLLPRQREPSPLLLTAPRFYQIGWAEMALARGYSVCLYPGVDYQHHERNYPDYDRIWKQFHREYPEATWCEISTKAWLASRALDYLLDSKSGCNIIQNQIAIIGWSRYGKQSMIAAAMDERITCVVARSSGSPATSPYRFSSHAEFGETPTGFPAKWFIQDLRLFNGREHEMPIDSHGWYALIAPRNCLIDTACNDGASDLTFAIERAYLEGKKVYELLGHPENLYLDYRVGGHEPLTNERRRRNIDWIDLCFGRGKSGHARFPEPQLIHQFDWQDWKAKQAEAELKPPVTSANAVSGAADKRLRVQWALGREPEKIEWNGKRTFISDKERKKKFGVDILPDIWASPDTARIPVNFGAGIRGNIYYNVKIKEPVPVVIWLHPYNQALGYNSGCEAVIPWGETARRTPYHYVAQNGYVVLAFDLTGFGTRLLEDRDFYKKYPAWSKLGRMVHDVRAAVDFIVAGRGRYQKNPPQIRKDHVYLMGYSLGGMVGLYSAALDERVKGVACFSGFTPMRTDTDAKSTGGIRRFWEWYALAPRLGLFHNRENELPYDYDDLLELIAPRPCLLVSQKRDRYTDFADVAACVARSRRAWESQGAANALQHLTPDDFSHFQDAQHDMFLNWIKKESVGLWLRQNPPSS